MTQTGHRARRPARLPTVGSYVEATGGPAWLWSWLASMPGWRRRGMRVADLHVHPAPGEHLGDEWQPVAECPGRPVYLVKRCP
jgi:hypothetical protein